MKLQEFNALVVGDKVENAMTRSEGVVSAVHTSRAYHNVSVKWGPGGIEFSYSAHSTAWFHWSKVEPAVPPANVHEAAWIGGMEPQA